MSPLSSGPAEPAPRLLDGLRWRLIGPFRGGRSVAVAGHPHDRLTFYFGSTGGGVWKTRDAGRTWHNVSDGYFRRASVGALAVADADPNVIYAGMGEACLRNSISHGDGVYRSNDAGRTWSHKGLAATRHIGRVRVDPGDPERVYVAALGHAHGPNPERGVYRSIDGGESWDLVLERGPDAGAVDLCIDATNPRRLYATTWQVRRLPWRIDSGGEGSGLWRSDDGGDTWVELSRKPGLPKGLLGRIGVAASPAKEGRLWAIVEAEDGGVFLSDDFGEHWIALSTQWGLRQRPFYYGHIFADPQDAETVWALNVFAWRSTDAGKTFTTWPTQHGDCHDLWIDPADTDRLILGDDGGAQVSLNGGRSWSSIFNQPTAELYCLSSDNRTPYRVYAAQQDNRTVSLPTHSSLGAITYLDASEVGGGEAGPIAVHPKDANIIYAGDNCGYLSRYDSATDELRVISVWEEPVASAEELRHRFNWNAPLLISPHEPHVIYYGGECVFASRDEGHSWEPISDDLSRRDPDKLKPSGGITRDTIGAEYWCTVFTLAESKLQPGLLWAGTDDGLIHLSDDGGEKWRTVTPAEIPEWASISIIEPSPHDARAAYVAVDNHRLDDFTPYLFKTKDLGASWERIDAGIPADEFCRVIRADPAQPGLLFAGTEAGIYVSYDDGANWASCRANLPVVPIHDLEIKGDDLVAATHGRSIWILDELPALRAYQPLRKSGLQLYPVRDIVRYRVRVHEDQGLPEGGQRVFGQWVIPYAVTPQEAGQPEEMVFLEAGENPAREVVVLYELDDPGDRELRVTFFDSAGQELRSFVVVGEAADTKPEPPPPGVTPHPEPPRRPGLNRFRWDTRPAPGIGIEVGRDDELRDNPAPEIAPGEYRVRVELGDGSVEESFRISADLRSRASAADHAAAHEFGVRIWERRSQLNSIVNRLRKLRGNIEHLTQGTEDEDIRKSTEVLLEDFSGIEERLVTPPGLQAPRVGLDRKLDRLTSIIPSLVPPTPATLELARSIEERLDAVAAEFEALLEGPVGELSARLEEAGIRRLTPT